MITQNNIISLQTILSNLSYRDYVIAYRNSDVYKKGRYTPTGKERKFKGHSLSDETLKVHDLLQLVNKGKLTNSEIAEIKDYLLKKKLLNPELLQQGYMIEHYKANK